MPKRRKEPKGPKVSHQEFMRVCEEAAKRLGIENWKPADLFVRRLGDDRVQG